MGLRVRPRASVNLEELIFGSDDQKQARFTARLGGLLFVAAGLLLTATLWLPTFDRSDQPVLWGITALSITVGVIVPRLPWERWSHRAYLAPVILSFVMIGVSSGAIPGVLNPYQVTYVMSFMFLGLTQPPGTATMMVPLAALTLLVPEVQVDAQEAAIAVIISAPVWLIIGETMSQSTVRLKQAERGTARLLEVSTSLAQAGSEDLAAGLTARFATELLDASWSILLTRSEADPLGYVTTARHGTTIPLGRAWKASDVEPGGASEIVALQRTGSDELTGHIAEYQPDTALITRIPLHTGGQSLGLLVVGWTDRRHKMSRFERRSMRLLAQETARSLSRLHDTRLLARDAETDPLTGLFNRRSYNRALEKLLPGDAVVLLDLDHFKTVNDRFGHATGDEVLTAFAEALTTIARKSDSVARYGGEEFAWILPEAGIEGARQAVDRLQALWRSGDPKTSFSAGIAIHTDRDVPTTTLARADHALYKAKNGGRDRIELAPAPSAEAGY